MVSNAGNPQPGCLFPVHQTGPFRADEKIVGDQLGFHEAQGFSFKQGPGLRRQGLNRIAAGQDLCLFFFQGVVGKPVNQADTFISNRNHGVGPDNEAVRHRDGMDPGKDAGSFSGSWP